MLNLYSAIPRNVIIACFKYVLVFNLLKKISLIIILRLNFLVPMVRFLVPLTGPVLGVENCCSSRKMQFVNGRRPFLLCFSSRPRSANNPTGIFVLHLISLFWGFKFYPNFKLPKIFDIWPLFGVPIFDSGGE